MSPKPDLAHKFGKGAEGSIAFDDIEDVYTYFQTPMYNFCYRMLGNPDQARDVVQEIMIKAYKALQGGTTVVAAAFSSWLYRIASNTCTDELRHRKVINWLPLPDDYEDRGVPAGYGNGSDAAPSDGEREQAMTEGIYDGRQFEKRIAEREAIMSVFQKMPEKYVTCLLLYEYEGYSCAEIAEMVGISPTAVKMRLMRARERFITLYRASA